MAGLKMEDAEIEIGAEPKLKDNMDSSEGLCKLC
jgi:hypothetical protein